MATTQTTFTYGDIVRYRGSVARWYGFLLKVIWAAPEQDYYVLSDYLHGNGIALRRTHARSLEPIPPSNILFLKCEDCGTDYVVIRGEGDACPLADSH